MGSKSGGGAAAPTVTLPADFDREYYLEANPDVKAAGVDPAQHYITHGYKEGRQYVRPDPYKAYRNTKNPTDGSFDEAYYLAQHPELRNDIATGKIPSAYAHYLMQGQSLGYAPKAPFTAQDNLNLLRQLGLNVTTVGQGEGNDALARSTPQIQQEYERIRRLSQPDYRYVENFTVPARDALNSAKSQAQQYVSGRGLNYGEFQNDIEQELQRIYQSIPYGLSVNASSYFDPNTASNVLSNVENTRRSNYTRDYSNLLPDTAGNDAFADTFDDDIINTILGEQYGKASGVLEGQKKRGVLNDAGYSSALSDLGKQKTEASSKLQSAGGNILTGYRGQLTDIIASGKKAASGYTLGSTFDANKYKTDFDAKKTDLSGRLEGDLRSSVGPDTLFDTQRSMASGGTGQGAQNTERQGILDLLAEREGQRRQRRGVGSQGVF